MPYTKTNWTDEIPASTPVKYKVTDDVLGIVASSAKIEVVTSVTAGTQLNAANMNKIEDALEDVADTADEAKATAETALSFAQAVLFVEKKTSKTITDATYTKIDAWSSPAVLSGGASFNATTGYVTLLPGMYVISARFRWSINAVGVRECAVEGYTSGAGSLKDAFPAVAGAYSTSLLADRLLTIASNAQVAVSGWQNSGGDLDLLEASWKITRIGD